MIANDNLSELLMDLYYSHTVCNSFLSQVNHAFTNFILKHFWNSCDFFVCNWKHMYHMNCIQKQYLNDIDKIKSKEKYPKTNTVLL